MPSDRHAFPARDILWHLGKTFLCLVQFAAATLCARYSVLSMASANGDDRQPNIAYWCILLLTQGILFFFLWNYYDDIDDRAFDRFCASEDTPRLLRDPAYLTGLILTTVGGAGCFLGGLLPLVRLLLPRLPELAAVAVGLAVGLPLAGGISVLRLRRRESIWRVQKTLRRPNDKRPSPLRRVVYAVIFGFVVLLLAVLLCSVVPYLVYLILSVLLLSRGLFIGLVCAVAAGTILLLLRRVRDRRKFLNRLSRLRECGELSFTVHGHPYLSLFLRRAEFGLTVTDEPHRESKHRSPVTYRVAVANCNRRRMTVVLCEDNRFQFMHALKLRVLSQPHVPALGTTRPLDIPIGAFFTTHDFDFPAGEGKRILIVDPAPHRLCMHGVKEGELIPLDNASEVFGYTVYGKNAFLGLLERT